MSEQKNVGMPDGYDPRKILQSYRHIAIVGISANPSRPSHSVALYLQAVGYDIIPINPHGGKTLLGKPVYGSLTEAKEAGELIEIVDVFRKAQDIPPIADEAIAIGAKVLWVQLGLYSEESARKAQVAGLTYVENRCLKIEHARFFRK